MLRPVKRTTRHSGLNDPHYRAVSSAVAGLGYDLASWNGRDCWAQGSHRVAER